jgi:hypothetical protein
LPVELLEVIRRRWNNDVSSPPPCCEEYNIGGAIEIALNELLDFAREHGFVVRSLHGDDLVTDLIVG